MENKEKLPNWVKLTYECTSEGMHCPVNSNNDNNDLKYTGKRMPQITERYSREKR